MPVTTRSSTKAETFESKESKDVVKNESTSKEKIGSTIMAAEAAEATDPSTGKEETESAVKALEVAVAENLSGSKEELEAAIQGQQVQTSVAHFTTVPNEIKLKILGYLGPVSSACLGVTCKAFYGFHRAKYGTVKLSTNEWGRTSRYVKGGDTLANSLISWVPENIRKYNCMEGVFVTEEKFQELVDEWYDHESQYFWHENFPGHYPKLEDDQIRITYLDALREHGMEYEDWPHPGEFVNDWLTDFVADWLSLCYYKNWDPHSEDHEGSKWTMINKGLRPDDPYAYSDTSEEENDEGDDNDEGEDNDEEETDVEDESKVENEDRVEAEIRIKAPSSPILPSFIIKGLMSSRSTTA